MTENSPTDVPLSSPAGVQARGGYLPPPSRALRRQGSHSCPDARYGRTAGGEEQTHPAPGTQASGLQPRRSQERSTVSIPFGLCCSDASRFLSCRRRFWPGVMRCHCALNSKVRVFSINDEIIYRLINLALINRE